MQCQIEPAGEVRSLPPICGGHGGGELPKFILNLEYILNKLESGILFDQFCFHVRVEKTYSPNSIFNLEMFSNFDQTHSPQAFEGCEQWDKRAVNHGDRSDASRA